MGKNALRPAPGWLRGVCVMWGFYELMMSPGRARINRRPGLLGLGNITYPTLLGVQFSSRFRRSHYSLWFLTSYLQIFHNKPIKMSSAEYYPFKVSLQWIVLYDCGISQLFHAISAVNVKNQIKLDSTDRWEYLNIIFSKTCVVVK